MSREDEIRARVEKATPGSWVTGNTRCVVWDQYYDRLVANCRTIADADFIVNAREDVPYLQGELKKARAEVERLRSENEELKGSVKINVTKIRRGKPMPYDFDEETT